MIARIPANDAGTKWSQLQRVLTRIIDSMGFGFGKKSTSAETAGTTIHDFSFKNKVRRF